MLTTLCWLLNLYLIWSEQKKTFQVHELSWYQNWPDTGQVLVVTIKTGLDTLFPAEQIDINDICTFQPPVL